MLTGKGLEYGGSLIRTEATGYGAVYFLENMLKTKGQDLAGKRAVISGSGNVATHAAEKIVQLGGKVLTLSDSEGFVHDPDGITQEKIDWVKAHKTRRRGRISRICRRIQERDLPRRQAPWGVPCDVALPCATQNELLGDDARTLVANGCIAVSEGANMPTDLEGVHVFKDAKIALRAGQGRQCRRRRRLRPRDEPEFERRIAGRRASSSSCSRTSWTASTSAASNMATRGGGYVDYVKGANIAGFKKVADAMLAFGVV